MHVATPSRGLLFTLAIVCVAALPILAFATAQAPGEWDGWTRPTDADSVLAGGYFCRGYDSADHEEGIVKCQGLFVTLSG